MLNKDKKQAVEEAVLEYKWMNVLKNYLKTKYLPHAADKIWNKRDDFFFSKGVKRLNKLFTHESRERPKNYFSDPVLRSGYMAYFYPVNVIKTKRILMNKLELIGNKNEIHIADFGAGPLTLSMGVLLALFELGKLDAKKNILITAIEQNKSIAQEGEKVLRAWIKENKIGCGIQIQILADDVKKIRGKFFPADMILCGNLLTEIPVREDQQELILKLWKIFSTNQTQLFILEPGTKKISRDLQALRDFFLSETNASVMAPCLHQKTCPLNLGAKSDWCHFTTHWEVPPLIGRLDKECGLNKSHLVYSYMVFANVPRQEESPQLFRAISHPLPNRDKKEIIGCGPAGRVRGILWSRDVAPANKDFTMVKRGDIYCLSRFPGDGFSTERSHIIGKTENVIIL